MHPLLITADALWPAADLAVQRPGRVLVAAGRIVATGPQAAQAAQAAAPDVLALPGCTLLPGFVTAHQHGRGLPQALMGYHDDRLEAWINRRRARGAPAVAPLVLLAAARMLAHGITGCLHANWSWGGPQEAELEQVQDAYAGAGIRAALCIGVADRCALLAPEDSQARFIAGLPPPLRALAQGVARQPFLHNAAAASDLRARLLRRRPDMPVLYGPSGPQWVSDGLLRDVAAAARNERTGLHMHLLESPAQARACAALYPEGTVRRLAALGVLGPHASLAHAVFATAQDMALLAESGTAVVLNPGSNLRLGNGVPPIAALRRAGVTLALGGDDCELHDDRDPWGELRLAVALSRSGDAASPPGAAAAEALAWATTHASAAMGVPDAGRILPGMRADIQAIADTPELLLPRASGRDVRMTMVGGVVRYREGRLTGLSLAALEEAALAAARAAWLHPSRDAAEVEALGRALLAFPDSEGRATPA